MSSEWGASSVGRALRSQRRGRGFNSPALHQPSLKLRLASQEALVKAALQSSSEGGVPPSWGACGGLAPSARVGKKGLRFEPPRDCSPTRAHTRCGLQEKMRRYRKKLAVQDDRKNNPREGPRKRDNQLAELRLWSMGELLGLLERMRCREYDPKASSLKLGSDDNLQYEPVHHGTHLALQT